MRKEIGITLVALIITIVLLILATVSISLVINSGIITKTKSAVDKYSEEEIGEQIKLAYLELQTEKLYNSNVDDAEFLTNSLKEKLNDNDLTAKVKKGKVTVNMTVKGEPKTYIYKSTTGEAYEYIDPLDYGGKEKKDLVPGDDISVGTEKFRVFYNKDGVIKAMPFYNIELKLDNPIQSSSAEKTTFSSTNYWTQKSDWNSNPVDDSVNITMTEKNTNGLYKNNIQQYIDAYRITLINMGVEYINTRACTKPELYSQLGAQLEEPLTGTQKQNIRNPGKSGDFWLASANLNNETYLWSVRGNGISYSDNGDEYNRTRGVRPIIIIEY